MGFSPELKRTVAFADRSGSSSGSATKKGGKSGGSDVVKLKIGKGLVDKVLSTGNDGGETWEVQNFKELREEVRKVDTEMSLKGYKTIGVVVSEDGGPMRLVGIIPMLDPPREDTQWVIDKMKESGIEVKMITGDHLNIAKETARLIGMNTNILPMARAMFMVMSSSLVWELSKDRRSPFAMPPRAGRFA